MKKLSIIVPVYNTEEYLPRCIDSLVNQTFKDLEIILIDDGSKDNSKKIINEYKKKYPKIIKSKTIKNSGAAQARTIGIQMAEGEYIGFVDSDDYVENTMYEKLYNKAVEENAEIVVTGYFLMTRSKAKEYQLGDVKQYGKSIEENPKIFLYGNPYLWNKIFKKELIINNNIQFNKDLKIFEDLEFVYKLFIKANKISKVNEPLYNYIKERDNSLTAQFTDKFFDIIPAIKSLNQFAKQQKNYENLKLYILYIAQKHAYIRCEKKVNKNEIKIKFKYIDEVFEFLDEEFPGWKEQDIYFKKNKKSKIRYTSKLYWKIRTIMQVLNLDKIYRKVKKNIKKVKNIFKKIKRYNINTARYSKYYDKLKIKENIFLIDSQHGNDINGNMFYIIKELNNNPEYDNYKIYLGVANDRVKEFKTKLKFYEMNKVNLVIQGNKKYMKLLASAKFLFSDTSFIINYIKKEGQVYLNTWHGTPLKTLGRSSKNDFENIPNLQKNFVTADYLLYPNEYMKDVMIEDYMLDNIARNKILMCGYPRNSIFFDEERRKKVREELDLIDKEIITYMPTWRGTLGKKNTDEYIKILNEHFDYLSENLKKNQVLFVNLHPYVKDYLNLEKYTNILSFPKQYETYDFLNISDILITDYSSVFFDFALTKKKIILFTYDEEQYLSERGLYIDLEQLNLTKVTTVKELVQEINNKDKVDYKEFIEKFCKYDAKDIPTKLCRKIILNQETEIKELDMPNNGKENVLILVRNFSDTKINEKLEKMIEGTNEKKYNYYVGYIYKYIKKYNDRLYMLPRSIRYMGQLYSMPNVSLKYKVLLRIYKKFNLKFKKYDTILEKELKRIYNDIDFKTVILLGERNRIRIEMFSKYKDTYKILYLKNNSLKENYKTIYDYIIQNEEIDKIEDLNQLTEIGQGNNKKLENIN